MAEDWFTDADRAAIYQTIARYCRAIDRLDWQGIEATYTSDGIDHHTGFDGSAREFVAWVRDRLPIFSGTMHLIGNHLVDPIASGIAISETYGMAVHWGTPRDGVLVNYSSGFRYVDHMRRAEGEWLVAERFAVREWTRSDEGGRVDPEFSGPRGTRDASDPLAQLRARLLADV